MWLIALVLMAVGAARAQWEILNSGTTADLRDIDNVGGGVAWASGTNGTVLRTEDGGYLWQTCAIPPGADRNWNALSLPFVVGPHGRIAKLNPKALMTKEGK